MKKIFSSVFFLTFFYFWVSTISPDVQSRCPLMVRAETQQFASVWVSFYGQQKWFNNINRYTEWHHIYQQWILDFSVDIFTIKGQFTGVHQLLESCLHSAAAELRPTRLFKQWPPLTWETESDYEHLHLLNRKVTHENTKLLNIVLIYSVWNQKNMLVWRNQHPLLI